MSLSVSGPTRCLEMTGPVPVEPALPLPFPADNQSPLLGGSCIRYDRAPRPPDAAPEGRPSAERAVDFEELVEAEYSDLYGAMCLITRVRCWSWAGGSEPVGALNCHTGDMGASQGLPEGKALHEEDQTTPRAHRHSCLASAFDTGRSQP
jgi:hypothetical protein